MIHKLTINCFIPPLGVRGLFIILLFAINTVVKSEDHVGDSIQAFHTNTVPVIDADSSDLCWQDAKWQPINYFWINYGVPIAPSDFTGRFKVLWNKTTNLLYFLVEITDDVFVKGYTFANNNGSYPNYDVVELFIDEDRSGGTHTFDNNAFAYHITGGNSSLSYTAVDIWGSTWATNKVDYSNHFTEYVRVFDGEHYYWEFSLMVLKNSFTPTLNTTDHKATLSAGKKMGLTLAYCDNDSQSENPLTRDNFIASKYVPQANYNDSYMNASLFGSLILADNNTTYLPSNTSEQPIKLYVDNSKRLLCHLENSWKNPTIQITDITGKIIFKNKIIDNTINDLSKFKKGCYVVSITDNQRIQSQKIIL